MRVGSAVGWRGACGQRDRCDSPARQKVHEIKPVGDRLSIGIERGTPVAVDITSCGRAMSIPVSGRQQFS